MGCKNFCVLKQLFARFFPVGRNGATKPLVSTKHDLVVIRRLHNKKMPRLGQISKISSLLSKKEKKVFQISLMAFVIGIIWTGVNYVLLNRDLVAAPGGEYVEAVVGTPKLVNPLFASVNDVDMDISRLVYNGLLRFDGSGQLVGDLAKEYSLSEDKKTYTFVLRDDVFWHVQNEKEGKVPFTARDVAFTFDLITQEEVGSPLRLGFQGVDVTVIDDYTVSFTLPEAFPPFLTSLTIGILPEHIWSAVPLEQLRLTQVNLKPIGTGPYQFSRLVKDGSGYISRYELKRNESYYSGPAYIETIAFQFYGSYTGDLGAIQAIRQGQVDGIHFVPSKYRDSVERKNTILHAMQLPQYSALFFNQERQPQLKSIKLREALDLALDKKRILQEALGKEGTAINSPLLEGTPGTQGKKFENHYNVDKANQILDELYERVSFDEFTDSVREKIREQIAPQFLADAVTSTDSVAVTTTPELEEAIESELARQVHSAQTFFRQDKDGNILELKMVTAQTEEYSQASKIIAGFWQGVGIKVTVEEVDPKQISRQTLKNRNYDVLLYGVIVGADPDQYPFWHSSQVNHPGLNLSQYKNSELDALLEKARESSDRDEIEQTYNKIEEILIDNVPAVFLYSPVYRYAQNSKLKGVDIGRISHPSDRFSLVTEWYIKTKGDWKFGQ